MLRKDRQKVYFVTEPDYDELKVIFGSVSPNSGRGELEPYGATLNYIVKILVESNQLKTTNLKKSSKFWIGFTTSPDVFNNPCTHEVEEILPYSTDKNLSWILLRATDNYEPFA